MRNLITAIFISLLFSSFVSAEEMQHHQHASQDAAVYHSKGIVKAWGEQKVSLAHPAIPALNWPPMTMNFLQPQPPLPALVGKLHPMGGIQPVAYFVVKTMHFRRRRKRRRERRKERGR